MSSQQTSPSPAELRAQRARSHGDLFAGLLIFAVGLYILVESLGMPTFGRGRAELSAPGLTPMLLSISLMLLSAFLCLRSWRAVLAAPRLRLSMESFRVAVVTAILVVYIALLPALGYVAATFLMLLCFQSAFARSWSLRYLLVWCLGLSGLLTAILWYVFARIFLIPIP